MMPVCDCKHCISCKCDGVSAHPALIGNRYPGWRAFTINHREISQKHLFVDRIAIRKAEMHSIPEQVIHLICIDRTTDNGSDNIRSEIVRRGSYQVNYYGGVQIPVSSD